MSQAVTADPSEIPGVPEVHSASGHAAYTHAVDQLYALGQELAPLPPLPDGTPAPRRKWDLAHMRTLAAALGNPQQTFPSVLIAGTNGKGSTAATLASILSAAGYKTGLYTSPHLVRVNERIQILPSTSDVSSFREAGGPASPLPATETPGAPSIAPLPLAMGGMKESPEIPDHTFARLFSRVDDTAAALVASGTLPHPPSFFEVLTALAFLYFAGEKVDIAVLEVGLGGRLDATNIVEPLISVITDIALDHQDYLGDTIAAITREKAGILRHNGILVTLPQHPEANQAIGEAAASLDLHAISAADFIPAQLPTPQLRAVPPHPVAVKPPHPNAVILSAAKDPDAAHNTTAARTFLPPEHVVPLTAQHDSLPHNHYTLTLNNEPLEVDSPLSGHHQQRNIALAIATANTLCNLNSYSKNISNQNSYKITNSAIEAGIRDTRWPGRLEFIAPNLLLDVAHNPAGAWTLRAAIAQLPESINPAPSSSVA